MEIMENVKARLSRVDKRGSFLFFLMLFTLGQMTPAFAASKSDCAYLKDDKRFVQEYRTCIRMDIASQGGVDCVDCLFQPKQEEDTWVDAVNAVAGPLAFLGSAYFGSKYQHESQEAWANAYETGHQACTNRFNSYLNYNQELGASPILPDQAESFANSCNGNSYGSYAGHGGFMGNGFGGSGNPFLSAGYSPGFMQGMMGPNYGGGSYGGSIGGGGYPGGYGFGAGGGSWGGSLLSALLGGGGGGINANLQIGGGGGAYPGGWGMGPNMGSGYGYGMQMPGYGQSFPGVGYGGGINIGAGGGPAHHGGGVGFPGGPGAGAGGGFQVGGGFPGGGGYPGAGGMMCIQAPCPGGPGAGGGGYGPGGGMVIGGGGLNYPGSGGGSTIGGGGNVTCMAIGCPGSGSGGGFHLGGGMNGGGYGRYPSNPWGGGGMVPGGAGVGVGGQFGTGYPSGSYWNNTGGWGPGGGWSGGGGPGGGAGGWAGGGGAGGGAGGAWYQQYQQQRRAQIDSALFQQQRNRGLAQTRQSSSQALQENYQQAGQDLYQQSYGNGGMGSVYGGSPYGAGNLGLHFSVGAGYGSGYSNY